MAKRNELALNDLCQVREALKAKLQELLKADASRIPALTLELQRLRVAAIMLKEMDEGVVDPAAYKELALLNRMIANSDVEGEAARQESEQDMARASRLLAERGVSALSAQRIIRVLTAASATPEAPAEEADDVTDLDPDADAEPTRRAG
jgi:hypothetical protein